MAPDDVSADTIEGIAEQLLAALADKLSDEPTDVMAVLRSMFTRPEAVVEAREAMLEQQRRTAERIDGEAPDLRAGLVGAITIGAVVGRHLLGLDGLRDASPEQVVAMLRPAFHELLGVPNPRAPRTPEPSGRPELPGRPARLAEGPSPGSGARLTPGRAPRRPSGRRPRCRPCGGSWRRRGGRGGRRPGLPWRR